MAAVWAKGRKKASQSSQDQLWRNDERRRGEDMDWGGLLRWRCPGVLQAQARGVVCHEEGPMPAARAQEHIALVSMPPAFRESPNSSSLNSDYIELLRWVG